MVTRLGRHAALSLLTTPPPLATVTPPQVMVRVGMLDKYAAFAAAVKAGQPYAPSVAASDTNGMRDAKHAATDIEADGSLG